MGHEETIACNGFKAESEKFKVGQGFGNSAQATLRRFWGAQEGLTGSHEHELNLVN